MPFLLVDAECAEEKFRPSEKKVYKKIGEDVLQLHIFYPEERGKKCPAIVFFHGGAWNRGSPNQFYAHCQHFASRGMVAISAEYRLNKKHGTTPIEALKDAKSAMRWVRLHAEELGIDTQRIIAGGGSAGGHLAAAVALIEKFNEEKENTNVSCKPSALILFNPVVDTSKEGFGYLRLREKALDFSPLHNIRVGAPPTIFFLGKQDAFIPEETAERYKQAMEKVGASIELVLYEKCGHGFFNYRGGNNSYYADTLKKADQFLQSLGYIKKSAD